MTDEFVLPMNARIYVMWALGNLVFVLVAIWKAIPAMVTAPVDILHGIVTAAFEDPPPAPVQMREPGWALREYRERMAA